MNDDFDDEEYVQSFPELGVYNPFWMVEAAITRASERMLWNGLLGLVHYVQEREQEEGHYHFHADELMDVIAQYMYTAKYEYPFQDGGEDEEVGVITEKEVDEFVKRLDMNIFPPYNKNESNEKETE